MNPTSVRKAQNENGSKNDLAGLRSKTVSRSILPPINTISKHQSLTSISNATKAWKGPAKVGLVSTESPDAVAAWRGKKRSQLYEQPMLACDPASRALVLPTPVCMLWPYWMKMETPSASAVTMSTTTESHNPIAGDLVGSSAAEPVSSQVKKGRQGQRPEMNRVLRSEYHYNKRTPWKKIDVGNNDAD